MKIIFSLITIFFLINSCYSETLYNLNLQAGTNCKFLGASNSTYDLSSIGFLNYTDTSIARDYKLNLCTALTGDQICNNLQKSAFICQQTASSSVALGLAANPATAIAANVDNTTLVSLKYGGGLCGVGTSITTTVNVQCGKTNQITSVTPASTSNNCALKYTIIIESPLVCSESNSPKKEGLSGGDVFLIIFFSVLGAYFIFGVIIQCYRGKRGAEAVPNIEFWRSFGSLIKDGVFFIKGKVTGTPSTPGYQQI